MVAVREEVRMDDVIDQYQNTSLLNEATRIYQHIISSLRKRVTLFVWQGFIEPLVPVSFEKKTLKLQAPTLFHRDWVHNHYLKEFLYHAEEMLQSPIQIIIEAQTDENALLKPKSAEKKPLLTPSSVHSQPEVAPVLTVPAPLEIPAPEPTFKIQKPVIETEFLNPNYTFETFISGPSNQMAFSACHAVAEQPGAQYSPLFLFGSAGLGKTHLLHAIGNAARAKNPQIRIVYMSAEQWVNAYIQAIRERRFDTFRNRFRSGCDLLLIDDIQFLAGKDASQDEFFHTFNTLHQAHKQIVVTSDKYPHEIQGLEERLQTRLAWGLIADVRPPELETRMAILHHKAKVLSIDLPSEVAQYLATNVTTSVRELEGSLIRLSAFNQFSPDKVTVAEAKEHLSPVFRRNSALITPEKICMLVAQHYQLSPAELKGASRQKQIALARQVAMAMCRTHLSMSLPEIGRAFGGRDHTTVLSSLRKINDLKEVDPSLQNDLETVEKNLLESTTTH